MIERNYNCDLCREYHDTNELVGIMWGGRGIEETPAHQTEHHLCFACLSGLQALPPRCGEGYKRKGGPKCTSDHK